MILRSLIEHVRTQNWLAVGLDFLIVVLGVFIGIQVSNWNDRLADKSREIHALELLLTEAENHVAYSELIIYRAGKLQRDREAAEAMLRGADPDEGDPVHGLSVMPVFRDMTPIDAAHDALTASGDINLIGSPEVRSALSLFNGVVIFHDRMRAEYIDRAPDIMEMASPYMTLRYAPDNSLGYVARVDWAAAGRDRSLVNAVAQVMGDQIVFSERRAIILENAQLLCEALAAELGKPCDPEDWVANEMAEEAAR